MNIFKSIGRLKYIGRKAIVEVDNDIAAYYRALLPTYLYVRPQKYQAHITAVRGGGAETITNLEYWGRYEGELIEFYYGPPVYYSGPYFFIEVLSKRIGLIRRELGLKEFRFDDTPFYHITIGNTK